MIPAERVRELVTELRARAAQCQALSPFLRTVADSDRTEGQATGLREAAELVEQLLKAEPGTVGDRP